MMKKILKSLKGERLGQSGFSLVEGVVALGLAAVIGVGGMKLSEQSNKQVSLTKQNLELDQYIRRLRTHLTDKVACNQIVSKSAGALKVNLQTFNAQVAPPMPVKNTKVIAPAVTGVGREVVPASVIVYFDRQTENLKSAYAVKKTTAMIEYNNGAFVGCSNYEAESEITTFKLACESLGGTFSLDTGKAGSEKCDFSAIGPDHYVLQQVKKRACEEIYNGSFDGVECNSMTMPTTPSYGANLTANSFLLSDKWVKTFNQSCPGQNNFVASVSSDGSVTCKTVAFCTKCDSFCPASGPLCDGDITNDREPAELNCDDNDEYFLSASNSATETNKCMFKDYSISSDEKSCKSKESTDATAGICKRFKSGTCDGTVAGTVENYPDGTSCGTDKTCQSGSCVKDEEEEDNSEGQRPKCKEGLNAFSSKSKCEAETGKSCEIKKFDLWWFPERVNDPVDTYRLPLCKNYIGRVCGHVGGSKACTSSRRSRGEEEILPCESVNRYCPSEEPEEPEEPEKPKKEGVWKKAFYSEDSCKEGVPKCTALIGKPCDNPGSGFRECNDNPGKKGPVGGTYCQINDVVTCEEK